MVKLPEPEATEGLNGRLRFVDRFLWGELGTEV